jgi:hypothetical protein
VRTLAKKVVEMLRVLGGLALTAVVFVILLVVWICCVVSGRGNRQEEKDCFDGQEWD